MVFEPQRLRAATGCDLVAAEGVAADVVAGMVAAAAGKMAAVAMPNCGREPHMRTCMRAQPSPTSTRTATIPTTTNGGLRALAGATHRRLPQSGQTRSVSPAATGIACRLSAFAQWPMLMHFPRGMVDFLQR
jgi:hypothetical protein